MLKPCSAASDGWLAGATNWHTEAADATLWSNRCIGGRHQARARRQGSCSTLCIGATMSSDMTSATTCALLPCASHKTRFRGVNQYCYALCLFQGFSGCSERAPCRFKHHVMTHIYHAMPPGRKTWLTLCRRPNKGFDRFCVLHRLLPGRRRQIRQQRLCPADLQARGRTPVAAAQRTGRRCLPGWLPPAGSPPCQLPTFNLMIDCPRWPWVISLVPAFRLISPTHVCGISSSTASAHVQLVTIYHSSAPGA